MIKNIDKLIKKVSCFDIVCSKSIFIQEPDFFEDLIFKNCSFEYYKKVFPNGKTKKEKNDEDGGIWPMFIFGCILGFIGLCSLNSYLPEKSHIGNLEGFIILPFFALVFSIIINNIIKPFYYSIIEGNIV